MCWSFQGFFGTWKVGATGEEEAAEENLSWETRIWVMVLGILKDELGLVKVGLALLVFVASSFRSGKQGLDDYKILPVFSSRLVCLHCSDFRSQEPISGNHFPVLQILIFVHFYCTLSLPMGQIPEEARPQSHCCSSGAIADEGETGSAWKPGQSEKFIGSPNSHSKDRICVVRMEQDAHWRFNAAFLSAPIRETFSRMRVLAANQVALGFFISLLYSNPQDLFQYWLLDFLELEQAPIPCSQVGVGVLMGCSTARIPVVLCCCSSGMRTWGFSHRSGDSVIGDGPTYATLPSIPYRLRHSFESFTCNRTFFPSLYLYFFILIGHSYSWKINCLLLKRSLTAIKTFFLTFDSS